ALPTPHADVAPAPIDPTLAQQFYPADLLQTRTPGEFRWVCTLFLNVQHLPQPGDIDDFIPHCLALLHQYGGYLCRIGPAGSQVPGGTMLCFWGGPVSHENDITRALNFVLELQSTLPVPVRAGLTYDLAYARLGAG